MIFASPNEDDYDKNHHYGNSEIADSYTIPIEATIHLERSVATCEQCIDTQNDIADKQDFYRC